MNTPIVLIIFNRPDTTEKIFSVLAEVKPAQLFVVADGPRADRPGEAEKCAATRAIIERVEWDCDLKKNYSEINLGCGRRPATGISWAFEHVEQAIILEDDCIPHPTFFPFCAELLERYRDDERITQICGFNEHATHHTAYSYFFSRYPHCWGWATWQRAWRHYDFDIRIWPDLRGTQWLAYILGNTRGARYWKDIFDDAFRCADKDFWDYQWTLCSWLQNGLTIKSTINLISNIGFGNTATHTKSPRSKIAYLPTTVMPFPLQHPAHVTPNSDIDRVIVEDMVSSQTSWSLRLRRFLYRNTPALIKKAVKRLSTVFVMPTLAISFALLNHMG